jgi:hypothetical protein
MEPEGSLPCRKNLPLELLIQFLKSLRIVQSPAEKSEDFYVKMNWKVYYLFTWIY